MMIESDVTSKLSGPQREHYWNEMSPSEKIEKLAEAVEIIGSSVVEFERQISLLNQHVHGPDGGILVPMVHNEAAQPWYKIHLLNRERK